MIIIQIQIETVIYEHCVIGWQDSKSNINQYKLWVVSCAAYLMSPKGWNPKTIFRHVIHHMSHMLTIIGLVSVLVGLKLPGFRSGSVQPPFGWPWTWTELSLSHLSDPDPIPMVRHWTGSIWVWTILLKSQKWHCFSVCQQINIILLLLSNKPLTHFLCWPVPQWA